MAHVIILEAIDDMAGSDPGGCFGELKGHMPGIETIEAQSPLTRTTEQVACLTKAEAIAAKFETEGFTPEEICGDTTELGNLLSAV